MNKEKLHQIIQQLEAANSKDEAYFAIEEDRNVYYVKANKAGLELIASEFLKAALEIDTEQDNRAHIPMDFSQSWLDGYLIEYIEPVDQLEYSEPVPFPKDNFLQKILFPVGCLGVFLVLLGTFIAGIVTVIGWFV